MNLVSKIDQFYMVKQQHPGGFSKEKKEKFDTLWTVL